jgi:hypothetical protein
MATKNTRAKTRSGPLSGRFTRNGWLTGAGTAVVAGLGAAFVLAAVIRWSDIGTDVMTAFSGNQAHGTVVEMTDAPAGAPEGAYVVIVEFMAASGSQRVSRRLVVPTGTEVEPGNRIRSDRPVRVSYRAGAPDRAVLWTLQEPWTAVWTVPVGLALIAVAWGLRPRM